MKQRKRKFLTRVTAFVLAMVLICPTMSVLAADVSESGVTEEGKDSEIQTIPNNTEITEEEKTKIENVSETFVDEGEVQENLVSKETEEGKDSEIQTIPNNTEITEEEKTKIENVSETFVDEGEVQENLVSKETEDEIEQQMNWTYVESSYLVTPGIQRIVVSWGEDAESVDDMTLKVQGSNGIQEEWAISNAVNNLYLFEKEFTDESQSGTYEATELTVKVGTSEKTQEEWAISNAVNNLYLFEKEFTDESQSGTYEATELTVKVGTSEKTFTMDEMGAEVLFGVNEEYAGVEELRPIEDEMNTDMKWGQKFYLG